MMNMIELIETARQGESLTSHRQLPSDLYKALLLSAQKAFESNDHGSAEEYAMQAIVIDHSQADGWALLGNVYQAVGLYVEAIQAWHAAFVVGENPRIALSMAQVSFALEFYDQASQFADAAIAFGFEDEQLIDQVNRLLVEIALRREAHGN